MTTSQNTVGDIAYVKVIKLRFHNLETFGRLSTPEPRLLRDAVDTSFGVAQEVLAIQRTLANSALAVGTSAAKSW